MSVPQIDIVTGIMLMLDEKCPGITANARQMNVIIKASTDIAKALNSPHAGAAENMGLQAWLRSDDTGSSSLYMAHVMFGAPYAAPAFPHDPDDFGRCYRLLKAVPGDKAKLEAMAATTPEWKALVANWTELERLYELEKPLKAAPMLHEAMQALCAGIATKAHDSKGSKA